MKLSEKLLKKIKSQFPEVMTDQYQSDAPLRAVKGINDGCRYKWSNGLVGNAHICSYETMKDCYEKEIFISEHSLNGCRYGWEIYIK